MYNLTIRKCTSPSLLAPRLKIFKWKFTTPLVDRTPGLLNQRQTCYHLSQVGEHNTLTLLVNINETELQIRSKAYSKVWLMPYKSEIYELLIWIYVINWMSIINNYGRICYQEPPNVFKTNVIIISQCLTYNLSLSLSYIYHLNQQKFLYKSENGCFV